MLGGGKAQNPPESGLGRSTLGCSTSLPESQSIDPGPMHPLDQVAGMGRRMILPYHDDVLLNLKAEGKLLAGGYAVGERAGAFIFEVDSNEELDGLLQGLPHWGLVKMKVTPLEDIEGRRERDRQQGEQTRQSLQR